MDRKPWPTDAKARLKLWDTFNVVFGRRRAKWYSITSRRKTHPEEFKADMAALFALLRDSAIHPVVIDRLPLAAAPDVHTRIDAGGLGGKIVLTPWPPKPSNTAAASSADAPSAIGDSAHQA
jgi:NADPH:quinone reductase-like Zn-dependent oxidoreductase